MIAIMPPSPYARQISCEHPLPPTFTYEDEVSDAPHVPMADEQASSLHKRAQRKKMILSIVIPFVFLQLLFLAVHSYVYGAVFQSMAGRVHNLKVLAVDYDGSAIGDSLRAAYGVRKDPGFPTLEWKTVEEMPTRQDVWEAVCKGDYWAGIYSMPGATDRLTKGIAGTLDKPYNPAEAVQFTWNEARYPESAIDNIKNKMEDLTDVTRRTWNHYNGSNVILNSPPTTQGEAEVLLNAIQPFNVNLAPSPQSVRIFYNTASQILAIAMQAFFVLALMAIFDHWNLNNRLSIMQIALLRGGLSILYTFISAMCVAALIYGFRETLDLSGQQFSQLWLGLWLYMHINYLVYDVATTFMSYTAVGLFSLLWVMANVTSTIIPVELSPAFYRWTYALPTYHIYQIEVQILARGCAPNLRVSLPVLFVWWIIFTAVATYGLVYRHNKALRAERLAFGEEPDEKLASDRSAEDLGQSNRTSLVWETPARTESEV